MARSARFLLAVLLLWAPVPLGSNRPIVWVANALIAILTLTFFLWGELRSGSQHNVDWRPIAFASVSFVLLVAWMVVQALPVAPPEWQHPIWSEFGGSLTAPALTISINPSSTWATIAAVAPIGLLAVVAFRSALVAQRAEFFLKLIVAATTAVAAYGLIAQYLSFRQIFLIDLDAYPGFLTGTFVGTNAASTYLLVGIIAAASLVFTRMEAPIRAGRRSRGSPFVDLLEAIQRGGVFIVAGLILSAALLSTGSRGGFLALLAGMAAVVVLCLYRAGRQRRYLTVGVVLVVAAIACVAVLSSGRLLGRLSTSLSGGDRLLVYRDTFDMLMARPWLGHGAGTFADAFPLFHANASSASVWNRAHNSYLQMAAELGMPAFVLGLSVILMLLWTATRRITDASVARPAGLAAAGVAAALALQSAVDFSVQVQAIGLTVVVLLGAGAGEASGVSARARAAASSTASHRDGWSFKQREVIDVSIPPLQKPASAEGQS